MIEGPCRGGDASGGRGDGANGGARHVIVGCLERGDGGGNTLNLGIDELARSRRD
jgi:hypothetical protein